MKKNFNIFIHSDHTLLISDESTVKTLNVLKLSDDFKKNIHKIFKFYLYNKINLIVENDFIVPEKKLNFIYLLLKMEQRLDILYQNLKT
jgi:hypothetical protein